MINDMPVHQISSYIMQSVQVENNVLEDELEQNQGVLSRPQE